MSRLTTVGFVCLSKLGYLFLVLGLFSILFAIMFPLVTFTACPLLLLFFYFFPSWADNFRMVTAAQTVDGHIDDVTGLKRVFLPNG